MKKKNADEREGSKEGREKEGRRKRWTEDEYYEIVAL